MPIQFSTDPQIAFKRHPRSEKIYKSIPFNLDIVWRSDNDPKDVSIKLEISNPSELKFNTGHDKIRYGYPSVKGKFTFTGIVFKYKSSNFDNLKIAGIHLTVYLKVKGTTTFISFNDYDFKVFRKITLL